MSDSKNSGRCPAKAATGALVQTLLYAGEDAAPPKSSQAERAASSMVVRAVVVVAVAVIGPGSLVALVGRVPTLIRCRSC